MANPPSATRFSLSSSSASDSISKLFEDAARSCPQRPAVQFELSGQVTYLQLRFMVDALAAELRGMVYKGQPVPVLLPRSVYQVCAILTLAKLGAVYVPLDVNMPASRLYSILSTTQATMVIAEGRFQSLFEGFNGSKLGFFDPLDSLGVAEGRTCPSGPCPAEDVTGPDDLAAVLFTSGSTGQPKGVMLSHRNLIEPVRLLSQLEKINPVSRILQFASCAFDVHLLDVFCAAFNGATLCQVSQENLASNLSGWVQDMAVDVAHLTPSVITLLESGRVYSLKHMVTCGEPVTQGIIQDWGGRVNLINLYGPCEASSVLAMVLQPGSKPNVFGPPSSHASVHVLDDTGKPVAAGVEGEIYCSGDSVALGYLGDDAATERSFRPSGSFGLVPSLKGNVLHATGDWGRLTAAGELVLLGRRDSQIKIDGQRVHLGEIHAVVDNISIGAVILPITGPTGRVKLFAFSTNGRVSDGPPEILPHDSALVRELYSACRISLPAYAIPRFVLLSAIPLTPSGKVDEQKLSRMVRDCSRENPPGHSDLLASRRPCASTDIVDLQEMLANMTAAPFSGGAPYINDDLRYYGLTSIDFMLLIKHVSSACGVSLTFQEVMRNPSIQAIAGILKEKLCQIGAGSWKDLAMTPDASTSTTPWVPASQSQGLILSAQSALQNHAYNCNFVIRVESFPLDPDRLVSALRVVCARHEVLRSTYHEGDNTMAPAYFQKVHTISELGPVCRIHGFEASYDAARGLEMALACITDEAELVFDLEQDSPVRMAAYQLNISGDDWIIHFNIHHVAIDEWGFSIVCHELESIYQALPAQGRDPSSSLGTAIQYREFSQYQRNKEMCHQRQERLKWWLNQLDAETLEPLMTELHVHRPTDALISFEKDTSLVYVQPLDASQVRSFESKQCAGSTPFIGWLTLCQVVLARMLRRSKFALAIPVTERGMDPAFQGVVGFCLNTLLIPVSLDPEDTVADSLSTTQRTFDTCVEHSLPLETVVQELNRSRAPNDKVRPQVMFVYHDPGRGDAMEPSSAKGFLRSAKQLQLASVGSRFDLVMHYCSKLGSDDAHIKIEYRRSLFSRELVATMARSIDAALGDLVAYGNQRACANINCLSSFDEARISEWSTPSPLPETMERIWLSGGGTLLHQLVESTARKMPLKTAVRTLDHALTYSELMAKATSLCRRLQTVGSIVGTRVLIFLSKSVELVVAELAVLVGGGTFVVLDPRHKRAINQDKLDTCRPGMVIVDSTTSALLPSPRSVSGVHRVNLSETAVISCTREEASGPARDDDAYLCFTSASTGNAKCFSVSHEASAASIMSHVDTFQLSPTDRVAMVSSISFDISILETFAAWTAGATLCIASEDDMLTDLAHTLACLEATCVFATPTLLSMIEGGPSTVPSLRLVATGGEPTPPKLFKQWVGWVDLRNAYGPAEVAMNTHTRRFLPHDPISRVGQRIGRPLPSVRSHVLDCNGNLALPGCVGYLHIGAREPDRLGHLSRGYISPASANARYKSHPRFGRLYDTGDLALYTFDGELNFLGRADDQVKVNGVRMNLGDVERALQGDHGQQVMAELGLDVSTGDQFVVVLLHVQNSQPRAERGLSCSWLHPPSPDVVQQLLQLRERAAANLIDAMMPRFWIPVSSRFPRSENAKVDRRAVKLWIAEFLSLGDSHIRNQYSALGLGQPHAQDIASTQRIRETNLGRTLIECWATVFGIPDEQVNPELPFLHVGGDSISAIRFVSRLRSQGVAGCTVSQLYESPTLTLLHAALEPLQAPSSRLRTGRTTSVAEDVYNGLEPSLAESAIMEATTLGISRSVVKRVYPTTSMQKTMLLASASQPGLYITRVTLHLEGPLDKDCMLRAWQAVCNAHPSMRTTFVSVRSRGILSFFSVEASAPALCSLPDIVESSVSQRTIQQIDTGWERGFRLGDAMFRLMMVEYKDRCHKLILSCHHASCDGWSLNIILRDLAQAYRGHPLAPSRPFSAVVAHLRDRSQSAARAYWQSYLEDYSHHSLAWDNRHAWMNLQMRAATQVLGLVSSHALADSARRHGVTPAVFLQAALAVLLSNVSGKDDVAFGQIVSGRHLPVDGVVDIVGDLLNMIPLRVTVDRDSEVGPWLRAVYQSSIESLEHHHILLEDIRRCAGGSELLETIFVFENHANRLDSSIFGSLELKSIHGQEFSNVPLTVIAEFVESGLMVTFKFNEAVLPGWRVESMIRAYGSIVADMLTGAAVSELGRSGLDEVVHVKEGFRLLDQQLENLGSHTLVSLFNTATYDFPDEVAIEEESRSVTFSELSRSSDAVCDYLVEAGIEAGQIVPILFDASVDMVVAMLGIMKAGATYCPIDVDSPDLRIRQTLRQVAAKVMIGDRVNGDRLSEELLAEVRFLHVVEMLSQPPCTDPRPVIFPKSPCYVLFTSGTTGTPKACLLSHGAVANAVLQTSSTTQLTRGSRVLLFASYNFDALVIDVFGCLATGGTMCISTPTKLRSNLGQVVNERLIDHAHLTPSVAQVLHPDDCKSLRTLVLGGERMSTVLQARWAGRLRLYDGYGPTECAVQVSTTLISPQSEVGVISRPLPGNVIILVDSHGRIPRVGEIGEICIGGCQVFEGYLDSAEETRSSLRSCKSFESRPLLGTGDLGVYRQDMTIRILGRKDTQVKLSGERVEVAEIESVIYSFAGVTRCAVLVDKNRLYAMVEKPKGASGSLPDQLRDWCLRWLPQRLVPRVLTWPSLPLTSSNKLNRKAVLQQLQEFESLHLTTSENAPSSETERSIASMIAEICGREVTDACLPLQHCGLNSLEILHLRSSMAALYRFTLELS
ncbi:hypothetical protein N0V84_011755 [Fusarium piperis]|uniref:Carrier domain-containing protein n=1 Tax=Fusarium piperis TaxID=1435070 RepID=A0A9W8TBC3_9HYPO|nr:hypothetical protein N0V84_011755 [Fusarium piperis]